MSVRLGRLLGHNPGSLNSMELILIALRYEALRFRRFYVRQQGIDDYRRHRLLRSHGVAAFP